MFPGLTKDFDGSALFLGMAAMLELDVGMNNLHFEISNTIEPSDSTFDNQMDHVILMHYLIDILASKITGKA